MPNRSLAPRATSSRIAAGSAAVLLAAALAACGDQGTSPVAPSASSDVNATAQITADVAHDAGEASATLNDTFGASESASGASSSREDASEGLLFSTAPSTNCAGPDASGFFTCTTAQENGFTVNRAIRYWSGGSIALRYIEASTDSVNHRWTLTGSHVTTDTSNGTTTRTMKANRADTATMKVVRGSTPAHVWSSVGVRHDTTTATDSKGTRRYVVTASDTAVAVTYLLPRKTNPWPLSGSVTHDIQTVWTGVNGATTTTTRRAVVTFNGTQTATVQVGALVCALDLKTHVASGCH